MAEIRRLKQLEHENGKLKRLVADLTLDKSMLQDAMKKMVRPSARRAVAALVPERFRPGASISTSWRCLAMSIATRTAPAGMDCKVVMVGLLFGVVRKNHRKRPETRPWPPAPHLGSCAVGHGLRQRFLS